MNANKRIAINSLLVFIKLAVSSIVGIITSRWILAALGIDNYGLYNVVGSLVVLLNVINTAMITTTYRYLAYEIGKKNNISNINAVFNRSMLLHILLALFIILMSESVGLLYVNNYMNISYNKITDAHFVLHLSTITAVFSALSVPFQGLLTAYEKFSIITSVGIFTEMYRLITIMCLTNYDGNALRMYSIIMIGISFIPFVLYCLYSKNKYADIIKWNLQRCWKCYKEMFVFSFWILLGALSSIVKTQGAQVVINFFFGTMINAAYAVASQINNALLMFSNNFSVAANPQITKSYSAGDINRSIKITCFISRISTFVMLVFGLPLFLETDFFFELWLKEVPPNATIFCKLMIIQAVIGALCSGIPALTQASGKIKLFQFIGSTLSLSSILFAFIIYNWGGRAESILIIYCVITAISLIVNIYLLKRILHINVMIFINKAYKRVLYVIMPLSVYVFVYFKLKQEAWCSMSGVLISEILLLFFIYYLGITNHERNYMINYIKTTMNRMKICKR